MAGRGPLVRNHFSPPKTHGIHWEGSARGRRDKATGAGLEGVRPGALPIQQEAKHERQRNRHR